MAQCTEPRPAVHAKLPTLCGCALRGNRAPSPFSKAHSSPSRWPAVVAVRRREEAVAAAVDWGEEAPTGIEMAPAPSGGIDPFPSASTEGPRSSAKRPPWRSPSRDAAARRPLNLRMRREIGKIVPPSLLRSAKTACICPTASSADMASSRPPSSLKGGVLCLFCGSQPLRPPCTPSLTQARPRDITKLPPRYGEFGHGAGGDAHEEQRR